MHIGMQAWPRCAHGARGPAGLGPAWVGPRRASACADGVCAGAPARGARGGAAQGSESAEAQAVRAAGGGARGATAYLNLESGDCHGDSAAVEALAAGGVARVVVGLRHPLRHLRGGGVAALRAAGVAVDVLGEPGGGGAAPAGGAADLLAVDAALQACLQVNEVRCRRRSSAFCCASAARGGAAACHAAARLPAATRCAV